MSRSRVLVTGVGGGVGQSIIKCLQKNSYETVGADGDPHAAGLYAVNHGYLIPYANALGFVSKISEIGKKEQCQLAFPGLDAELPILARCATEILNQSGMRVVVSSPEVVEISDDKWKTFEFLTKHGFPAPRTAVLKDKAAAAIGYPLVLKPKVGGARSRGVYMVHNEQEFDYYRSHVDVRNYVAQEYIDGDEYTCGTLTFDGVCRGVIVTRRVLRDGDTYKAFVERNEAIEDQVKQTAEALRPFGPCNFQLRVRAGTIYILEINARCSGTTYCRALAGFNEPLMTANYLLHGLEPRFEIREISVFRYWKELVVDNKAIEQLRSEGTVNAGSPL